VGRRGEGRRTRTKEAKPKKGGETDRNPPRLGRTASYLNRAPASIRVVRMQGEDKNWGGWESARIETSSVRSVGWTRACSRYVRRHGRDHMSTRDNLVIGRVRAHRMCLTIQYRRPAPRQTWWKTLACLTRGALGHRAVYMQLVGSKDSDGCGSAVRRSGQVLVNRSTRRWPLVAVWLSNRF